MLPKSVQNMLILPDDWRELSAGAVAADLLAQVPEQPGQPEFVRQLIRASLELMLTALGHNTDPEWRVQPEGDNKWRVRSLLYAWFLAVDDDVLDDCIRLAAETPSPFVIVPSNTDYLLSRALHSVLSGPPPNIFSIDSFISWRVAFASADAHWSHDRTLLDLFTRCNQHVMDAGLSHAILVEIPPISE
jgi:hypothetical protein